MTQAVVKTETRKSLVATLAAQYEMEPGPFMETIRQTVMPSKVQVSNEMIAAFLMVCHEHGLNPFTREIFAFPTKSGGIQPIVSVDGWAKMVIQHPQYNGMDIEMKLDEAGKKPISCTCTIYRKDRERSTPITEYYDECYRNTDPWNTMPKRMMRHKAIKEAARMTFGFALPDEDEGRDMINITEQSTVLERSTEKKTDSLKEKIGAKQQKKQDPEPVVSQPTDPEPAVAPVSTEPETIEPQEPAEEQPKVLISDAQRKAFIAEATKKATDLGLDETTTKTRLREIIFNAGFTKLAEVTTDCYQEVLNQVKSWK